VTTLDVLPRVAVAQHLDQRVERAASRSSSAIVSSRTVSQASRSGSTAKARRKAHENAQL
jgi:hypothetical protein